MKHAIPYFVMPVVLAASGSLAMSVGGDYLPGRLGTFLGGVLAVASLVACFTDLWAGTIRNSTTLSAFVIVAAVYLLIVPLHEWVNKISTGFVDELIRRHEALSRWGTIPHNQVLLGFTVCFFLTAVPYWMSGKGAGDVKLAALFGAILGPWPGLAAVVLAYAIGAVILFSGHLIHYGVRTTFRAIYQSIFSWIVPLWVAPPDGQEALLLKRTIPLGPGFCVAAFAVLWYQSVPSVNFSPYLFE